MNKKGYSLIELIVAVFILINVIGIFFYIIKNTILFVDLNKQEIVMFNNIGEIKSNISKLFEHDKIHIIPIKEMGSEGIYSIKDNFYDKNNLYNNDTLSLYYEDKTVSGSINLTNSGFITIGTIDRINHKLILPGTGDSGGFFAYNYLKSNENLKDYFINSTNDGKAINEYTNTNINIKGFKYSLVNDGAYLRIDINYDNDVQGKYKKSGNKDEYYFSGSLFLIKKIDL